MSDAAAKEIRHKLDAAQKRARAGKYDRYDGEFALLPDEVLMSEAVRTVPLPAFAVLVALAAQCRRTNNGSLTLPRRSKSPKQSSAARYGVGSPYTFERSLRELEVRWLILRTRPGRRLPPRTAMFALTWWPITEPRRDDPHDARPTLQASHQWQHWKSSKLARHWLVAESEKRRDAKRREAEKHDGKLASRGIPWLHRLVAPGLHEKSETGSPGLPVDGIQPVARSDSSDISGVGAGEGSKAKRAQRGAGSPSKSRPPVSDVTQVAAPALAAATGEPKPGQASLQAAPIVRHAQAWPAPTAVLSEEVAKALLITRLIADGFLTPESTTPRVSRLIRDQGAPFAVAAEQELDRLGLTGVAASLHLDHLAGMSLEAAERRLDEHLALKIGKYYANGERAESREIIKSRARDIAGMREAGFTLIGHKLGWNEVWSIFLQLGEDRSIRHLLIHGLLRHCWQKSLDAKESVATVDATS